MTEEEFDQYVLPTYPRFPLTIVKAQGSYIYDETGKKYLDFMSGWGVSNLGHRPVPVVDAIQDQLKQLIHVPNVFYLEPQGELARLLVQNSIDGQVFFCNSGAEANEAAIKFAKLYGKGKRHKIITAERSFHGRTTAAMAATGQVAIKEGFEPLLEGFAHVPFNDSGALEEAVDKETLAVMLEPVQGEGGIHVADRKYMADVRRICSEKDLLLIVDEVQTGIGRTGTLFAYQDYGIEPDIITCAKSLASGLPIGATIVADKIAKLVKPGMHGSTFGGGSLVSAAAIATLKMAMDPKIQGNGELISEILATRLAGLEDKHESIRQIRQKGLMIGIELDRDSKPVAEACLEKGLFINSTQKKVLRLLPPITATGEEAAQAVSIIDEALSELA